MCFVMTAIEGIGQAVEKLISSLPDNYALRELSEALRQIQ